MGDQLPLTTATMDDSFLSESFSINIPEFKLTVKLLCRWRLSPPVVRDDTSESVSPHFYSLDLVLSVTSTHKDDTGNEANEEDDNVIDGTGTSLEAIVHSWLVTMALNAHEGGIRSEIEALVKVILVPRDGYLCRRDILELRMAHVESIENVVPFSIADKLYSATQPWKQKNLLPLLQSSPGALIYKQSVSPVSHLEAFDLLEREVLKRLSFEWVLPTQAPALSVAVVGGRPLFDNTTGAYGSEGPFDAARALGISVIVLDRPGHFMEDVKYSHLRDDFIAVDMTSDADLPQKLAEAVRSRNVDGIITFSDEYVIATAKAAKLLNLETEPVESIVAAHYKDETRKILNTPNFQALRLDNAAQLDEASWAGKLESLRYPLVIKPCRGGASRGVKKVQDQSGLRQALLQMEKDGLTKHGILLETYVSGPEVDANIALWNAELLFIEITDDFPCTADASDATIADSFGETIMLSPTRLSAQEQELLKTSLHKSLLKLGFRNGIFHVEARVQNSSMTYHDTDGVVDLVASSTTPQGYPEVYLIEVNARPPGLDCAFSTLYTYGVDLCALQLLQCLNDGSRFAALCKPFLSNTQYWCGNCLIPIHRNNVLVPEGFCKKVLARIPGDAPFVSRAELFRQPGTVVSPPLGVEFLAYFLVFSRVDRRQVLQIYYRLLQTCKDVLDGA
ncbi:glutathione synthetase ATP-binding domain-like protein [Trichoderma afarasin]